jgi:hypothetical protein
MIAEQLNNVIQAIVLMPVMWINVELMLYVQPGSMHPLVLAHQIILEIQRKHVIQFHQLDPLMLPWVVAMIKNVLIGMLALILYVKTHAHLILVQ